MGDDIAVHARKALLTFHYISYVSYTYRIDLYHFSSSSSSSSSFFFLFLTALAAKRRSISFSLSLALSLFLSGYRKFAGYKFHLL